MYACAFVSIFPFSLVGSFNYHSNTVNKVHSSTPLAHAGPIQLCVHITDLSLPCSCLPAVIESRFPCAEPSAHGDVALLCHVLALLWIKECFLWLRVSSVTWLCGDVGLYPLCFPGKQQNQMHRPKFKKPFYANLGSV